MPTIKPLPITGTKVTIIGGPYKSMSGTVDCYRNGQCHCSLQKPGNKGWQLCGPIRPEHIQEVKR